MNKVTIFTVLLSLVVLVTVAQLTLRDKFQAYQGFTSVIGEEKNSEETAESATETGETVTTTAPEEETVFDPSLPVAEDIAPSVLPPEITMEITESDLASAGFSGMTIERNEFSGTIFNLIETESRANEYRVTDGSETYGVITVTKHDDESRLQNAYDQMKERALTFQDISVNETNQYGDQSFYVNDARRTGTAFLIAKLPHAIYTFAYPKANHEYYKRLIEILYGKEN